MQSLAMIASLRVDAHVGHSTGGSRPLSQKKGMPTGDRDIGTVADCTMLCTPNLVFGDCYVK